MATRFLTDEPLKVVPGLVGAPLASPLRRAFAFAFDVAILVLPSLAVAVAAALAGLAATQPRALAALRDLVFHRGSLDPAERHAALRELAPLLVRLEADGLPEEISGAVRAGDLDRAADELDRRSLVIAMALSEHSKPAAPSGAVRFPLERLIPEGVRGVALYGVAALYFGAMTRGQRGATLGKRLAGIRVVTLNGERLSAAESLERFVGYLHIPGSLGLSLLYLWRDPNRRLPHDRVAHTAVVRAPRASERPAAGRARPAPDAEPPGPAPDGGEGGAPPPSGEPRP